MGSKGASTGRRGRGGGGLGGWDGFRDMMTREHDQDHQAQKRKLEREEVEWAHKRDDLVANALNRRLAVTRDEAAVHMHAAPGTSWAQALAEAEERYDKVHASM